MIIHPLQMVGLYNDPKGNTIFDKADAAVTRGSINNSLDNICEDTLGRNRKTIESLRKRILELESALSQKQAQL